MKARIELQRMIDTAYRQLRNDEDTSLVSGMFIEHYEHLQRRYTRTFGDKYEPKLELTLSNLEEVARELAG